jgi:hypothetical protein
MVYVSMQESPNFQFGYVLNRKVVYFHSLGFIHKSVGINAKNIAKPQSSDFSSKSL